MLDIRSSMEELSAWSVKIGLGTELGYRTGNLYQLVQDHSIPTIESTPANRAHPGLATNQLPLVLLETWQRRLCHCTLNTTTIQYISPKVAHLDVSETKETILKICGICAHRRQHKESVTTT